MDAVRRAGVVAFLDWIRRNHPGVRSLRQMPREEFMALAMEYESSKRGSAPNASQQWEGTYWIFEHSESDQQALNSLPT